MSISSSDDQIPITSRHRKKQQVVDESTSESENDTETILQSLSKYRYSKQMIYNHSDSDESHEFIIPSQTEAKLPEKLNSVNNLSLNHNTNNFNTYQNDSTADESTSPIILSSRARHKTQTKLTNFFAPLTNNNTNNNINKNRISPRTALKNTPYQGLNTSTKNKFDKLSISEITQEIQDCQQILNNNELTNNLPDFGKRLKIKMQLLDEALIRVKARNIIHNKNNPIRKTLNFNMNFNSNRNRNRIHTQNNPTKNIKFRNYSQNNKLAQNLNKNDLNALINSIHTMSINPNNNNNNNNNRIINGNIKISSNLKCTLYPHQIYGYKWMINRETHKCDGQPYGGIIADEMGLGKTMQMIAVMLSKHKIPNDNSNDIDLKPSECTLIICPLSVMDHWENEIRKYTTRGVLIINKYHGTNRCKNIRKLISNYNVIITTYGCVQSEWNGWKKLEDDRLSKIKDIRKQIVMLQRPYSINNDDNMNKLKKLKIKLHILINKKYRKPILSEIYFHRIVLDEAHQIKNYKSKTHKSVCDLYGKCYWFMTATPIQNSLDDLYAAFHFLKYKYYSNYNNWKQAILSHSKGIKKIRTLLAIIMLRRMKKDYITSDTISTEKEEEKKVIQLPPKKAITHLIEFNEYERFIYKQLSCMMNKIFVGYQENNSVGKNFSQCLKMLLQLRQACSHLILIRNSVYRIHSILKNGENKRQNMDITQLLSVMDGNDMNHSEEYMKEIKNALESGNDECPFCLDLIENVSITDCGHRFCTQCINQIIDEKELVLRRKLKSIYSANHLYIQCPVCRKKLKKSNITQIIDKNNEKNKQNIKFIENANEYLSQPSSKLKTLMGIINNIKQTEASSKCVIFSQWTSMLDIIEKELKYKNKYFGQYCRLDGKMTANQRSKSINKLNTDRKCWIMLISLKAGGVGLNLVAANHVFLMDIWWNPAIEDQALDRVHRIGQTKNVTMHRIIINDSVEQKVLKLQDKKRKIAQEALNMNNNNNKNKQKRSVNLNARDLIDLFRDDVMTNNHRNNYYRNRI